MGFYLHVQFCKLDKERFSRITLNQKKFENVMMQFIISKRTDAQKNLLKYTRL